MKIAVVGGGVAGWLTALKLQKSFSDKKLKTDITVIESPNEPIIGVGEATVDSFPAFLSELDIPIHEFVTNVQATFKNGILFENWNPKRALFFHPYFGQGPKFEVIQSCISNKVPIEQLFISTYLGKYHLSPCLKPGRAELNHAYHFDTSKFAKYLSKVAKQRNIKHKLIDVVGVEQNTDGSIKNLHLEGGEKIKADYYFDCSGFRSVLLGRALGLKFVSFADYLPNDRALAGHINYPDTKKPMPSYTRATARKHGWQWTIPTNERFGIGYVYSSQFVSDSDAEAEFRREAKIPESTILKKINMKIGHYEKFMFKNCVGIGLSTGFIEPLESSGIRFITRGLNVFTHLYFNKKQNIEEEFNKLMKTDYVSTRNFVATHFMASPRSDTAYWQRQQELKNIKQDIVEICHDLKNVLTSKFENKFDKKIIGWESRNYLCILDGLGFFNSTKKIKEAHSPLVSMFPLWNEARAKKFLSHKRGLISMKQPKA